MAKFHVFTMTDHRPVAPIHMSPDTVKGYSYESRAEQDAAALAKSKNVDTCVVEIKSGFEVQQTTTVVKVPA
jgi:molybdate-binding protein